MNRLVRSLNNYAVRRDELLRGKDEETKDEGKGHKLDTTKCKGKRARQAENCATRLGVR